MKILKKAFCAFVAGVFLFNDIASAADFRNLAPQTGVTLQEFRDRYLTGYILLSHKAVNSYIENYLTSVLDPIRDEKTRLLQADIRWDKVKVSYNNNTETVDARIVPIRGLLKRTGQLAHIGLGNAKNIGYPSIYIDYDYRYDEDLLANEKEKIVKWEWKKRELGKTYSEMREWIKSNPEDARALAARFHKTSRGITHLYDEIKKRYQIALNADNLEECQSILDFDQMHEYYEQFGLDEGSNDANLAASPAKDKVDEFDGYLEKENIFQYEELRKIFSKNGTEIQRIKKELLEDPALRPVFLLLLPPAYLGAIEAIDGEATSAIGGISILHRHSAILAGSPEHANELAKRGHEIIIGVTDRYSRNTLHPLVSIANNRQVYFPLLDGTWLGVKGIGQFQETDQPPYFLSSGNQNIGMVTIEEALRAEKSREVFKGSKGRRVQFLGYRKIGVLPYGQPNLVDATFLKETDGTPLIPVLVFNRTVHPHRLVKLPQLLEQDYRLEKLTKKISATLARSGSLPPGTTLSPSSLMLMISREMGLSEAENINRGWYKYTTHSQDFNFAGEEHDNEEYFDKLTYTSHVLSGDANLETEDKETLTQYGFGIAGVKRKVKVLIDMIMLTQWYEPYQIDMLFPDRPNLLKEFFTEFFEQLDDRFLKCWTPELTLKVASIKAIRYFYSKREGSEGLVEDSYWQGILCADINRWVQDARTRRGYGDRNSDHLSERNGGSADLGRPLIGPLMLFMAVPSWIVIAKACATKAQAWLAKRRSSSTSDASQEIHVQEHSQELARTIAQGITLSFGFGAILGLTGFLFSGWMLTVFFGPEQAVAVFGSEFLKIYFIGMCCALFIFPSIEVLRCLKLDKSAMAIMGVHTVVNLSLDYLLIFGNCGFPRLGVAGYALATVIADSFAGLYVLFLIFSSCRIRVENNHPANGNDQNMVGAILKKAILKKSWPTAISEILIIANGIAEAAFVCRFSGSALAGVGLALAIIGLFSIPRAIIFTGINPFLSKAVGSIEKELQDRQSERFVIVRFKPRQFIETDMMKRIFKKGMPSLFEQVIGVGRVLCINMIVAGLGTTALIAYNVINRVYGAGMFFMGVLANSARRLAGEYKGYHDNNQAVRSTWYCTVLATGLTLSLSAIIFSLPGLCAGLISPDQKVISLAIASLPIVAFALVAHSVAQVLSSSLIGAGDTRSPILISIGTVTFLSTMLAYVLSITCGWNLEGIYWANAIGAVIQVVCVNHVFNKGRWMLNHSPFVFSEKKTETESFKNFETQRVLIEIKDGDIHLVGLDEEPIIAKNLAIFETRLKRMFRHLSQEITRAPPGRLQIPVRITPHTGKREVAGVGYLRLMGEYDGGMREVELFPIVTQRINEVARLLRVSKKEANDFVTTLLLDTFKRAIETEQQKRCVQTECDSWFVGWLHRQENKSFLKAVKAVVSPTNQNGAYLLDGELKSEIGITGIRDGSRGELKPVSPTNLNLNAPTAIAKPASGAAATDSKRRSSSGAVTNMSGIFQNNVSHKSPLTNDEMTALRMSPNHAARAHSLNPENSHGIDYFDIIKTAILTDSDLSIQRVIADRVLVDQTVEDDGIGGYIKHDKYLDMPPEAKLTAEEMAHFVKELAGFAENALNDFFHRFRAYMILYAIFHAEVETCVKPDDAVAQEYLEKALGPEGVQAKGVERLIEDVLGEEPRSPQRKEDYRPRVSPEFLEKTVTVRSGVRGMLYSGIGNDHVNLALQTGADCVNVTMEMKNRNAGSHYDFPIRAGVSLVDKPVIKLVAVNGGLKTASEISSLSEIYAYSRDGRFATHKAALVASGIIPETFKNKAGITLQDILKLFTGYDNKGIEIYTEASGLPPQSGMGTSSAIGAAILTALSKFSGQSETDGPSLTRNDIARSAAGTLYIEQLTGSLGGWQDAYSMLPGIKLLHTEKGQLLPDYRRLNQAAQRKIEETVKFVWGGLKRSAVSGSAWQFTGLYALRIEPIVKARARARQITGRQSALIEAGNIADLSRLEEEKNKQWFIVAPAAHNRYFWRLRHALSLRLGSDAFVIGACGSTYGAGNKVIIKPGAVVPEGMPNAGRKVSDVFEETFVEVARTIQNEMKSDPAYSSYEFSDIKPMVYDYRISDRGYEILIESYTKAAEGKSGNRQSSSGADNRMSRDRAPAETKASFNHETLETVERAKLFLSSDEGRSWVDYFMSVSAKYALSSHQQDPMAYMGTAFRAFSEEMDICDPSDPDFERNAKHRIKQRIIDEMRVEKRQTRPGNTDKIVQEIRSRNSKSESPIYASNNSSAFKGANKDNKLALFSDMQSDLGTMLEEMLIVRSDDVSKRRLNVKQQLLNMVYSEKAGLTQRQRYVLIRLYIDDDGPRMADVAHELGLGKTAVVIANKIAVNKLREAFGDGTVEKDIPAKGAQIVPKRLKKDIIAIPRSAEQEGEGAGQRLSSSGAADAGEEDIHPGSVPDSQVGKIQDPIERRIIEFFVAHGKEKPKGFGVNEIRDALSYRNENRIYQRLYKCLNRLVKSGFIKLTSAKGKKPLTYALAKVDLRNDAKPAPGKDAPATAKKSVKLEQGNLYKFLVNKDTSCSLSAYDAIAIGDIITLLVLPSHEEDRLKFMKKAQGLLNQYGYINPILLDRPDQWRVGKGVVIKESEGRGSFEVLTIGEFSPVLGDAGNPDAFAPLSRKILIQREEVLCGNVFLEKQPIQKEQHTLCIGQKVEVNSKKLRDILDPDFRGILREKLPLWLQGTVISYQFGGYQIAYTVPVHKEDGFFKGHVMPLALQQIGELRKKGGLRLLAPAVRSAKQSGKRKPQDGLSADRFATGPGSDREDTFIGDQSAARPDDSAAAADETENAGGAQNESSSEVFSRAVRIVERRLRNIYGNRWDIDYEHCATVGVEEAVISMDSTKGVPALTWLCKKGQFAAIDAVRKEVGRRGSAGRLKPLIRQFSTIDDDSKNASMQDVEKDATTFFDEGVKPLLSPAAEVIIRLYSEGKIAREIGIILDKSEHTVYSLIAHIKNQLRNREYVDLDFSLNASMISPGYGRRIKRAREALAMSSEMFSKKMDVTVATITQWENEKNPPKYNKLAVLAMITEIPLEYFLKGEKSDIASARIQQMIASLVGSGNSNRGVSKMDIPQSAKRTGAKQSPQGNVFTDKGATGNIGDPKKISKGGELIDPATPPTIPLAAKTAPGDSAAAADEKGQGARVKSPDERVSAAGGRVSRSGMSSKDASYLLYSKLPLEKKTDDLYKLIRDFHDEFYYPVPRTFVGLRKKFDSYWSGKAIEGDRRDAIVVFVENKPVAILGFGMRAKGSIAWDEGSFVCEAGRGKGIMSYNVLFHSLDILLHMLNDKKIKKFSIGNPTFPESGPVKKTRAAQVLSERTIKKYQNAVEGLVRTPAGKISKYSINIGKIGINTVPAVPDDSAAAAANTGKEGISPGNVPDSVSSTLAICGKEYRVPANILRHIRKARPEDAERLSELSVLIFEPMGHKHGTATYYKAVVKGGLFDIWVYVDAADIAQGYCFAGFNKTTNMVELYETAVAQEIQKQGIATTLTAVVMSEMEKRGAVKFHGYAENQISGKLLEKFGFTCDNINTVYGSGHYYFSVPASGSVSISGVQSAESTGGAVPDEKGFKRSNIHRYEDGHPADLPKPDNGAAAVDGVAQNRPSREDAKKVSRGDELNKTSTSNTTFDVNRRQFLKVIAVFASKIHSLDISEIAANRHVAPDIAKTVSFFVEKTSGKAARPIESLASLIASFDMEGFIVGGSWYFGRETTLEMDGGDDPKLVTDKAIHLLRNDAIALQACADKLKSGNGSQNISEIINAWERLLNEQVRRRGVILKSKKRMEEFFLKVGEKRDLGVAGYEAATQALDKHRVNLDCLRKDVSPNDIASLLADSMKKRAKDLLALADKYEPILGKWAQEINLNKTLGDKERAANTKSAYGVAKTDVVVPKKSPVENHEFANPPEQTISTSAQPELVDEPYTALSIPLPQVTISGDEVKFTTTHRQTGRTPADEHQLWSMRQAGGEPHFASDGVEKSQAHTGTNKATVSRREMLKMMLMAAASPKTTLNTITQAASIDKIGFSGNLEGLNATDSWLLKKAMRIVTSHNFCHGISRRYSQMLYNKVSKSFAEGKKFTEATDSPLGALAETLDRKITAVLSEKEMAILRKEFEIILADIKSIIAQNGAAWERDKEDMMIWAKLCEHPSGLQNVAEELFIHQEMNKRLESLLIQSMKPLLTELDGCFEASKLLPKSRYDIMVNGIIGQKELPEIESLQVNVDSVEQKIDSPILRSAELQLNSPLQSTEIAPGDSAAAAADSIANEKPLAVGQEAVKASAETTDKLPGVLGVARNSKNPDQNNKNQSTNQENEQSIHIQSPSLLRNVATTNEAIKTDSPTTNTIGRNDEPGINSPMTSAAKTNLPISNNALDSSNRCVLPNLIIGDSLPQEAGSVKAIVPEKGPEPLAASQLGFAARADAAANTGGLDIEKMAALQYSKHFIRAARYFNSDVLGSPLTWENLLRLFEIFRADDENKLYDSGIRNNRLRTLQEIVSKRIDIIKLANLHYSTQEQVIKHAAWVYYYIVSKQVLAGKSNALLPGFDEIYSFSESSDYPHPGSGHNRLAYFVMNYILINNGLLPVYFDIYERVDIGRHDMAYTEKALARKLSSQGAAAADGQSVYRTKPQPEEIANSFGRFTDADTFASKIKILLARLNEEAHARAVTGDILIVGPGPSAEEIAAVFKTMPDLHSVTVCEPDGGHVRNLKQDLRRWHGIDLSKIRIVPDFFQNISGQFDIVISNAVIDDTLSRHLDRPRLIEWTAAIKNLLKKDGIYLTQSSNRSPFLKNGFKLRTLWNRLPKGSPLWEHGPFIAVLNPAVFRKAKDSVAKSAGEALPVKGFKPTNIHRQTPFDEFLNVAPLPEDETISAKGAAATAEKIEPSPAQLLEEALKLPSDGRIIDLTIASEYKPGKEEDFVWPDDPDQKLIRHENLRYVLNNAPSRETVVVFGAGSADYSVLSEYDDIKRVILVDIAAKPLEAAFKSFPEDYRNKVYLVQADLAGLTNDFYDGLITLLSEKSMDVNDKLDRLCAYLQNLNAEGYSLRRSVFPPGFADVLIADKIYESCAANLTDFIINVFIESLKLEESSSLDENQISAISEKIRETMHTAAGKMQIKDWHDITKDTGVVYVSYAYSTKYYASAETGTIRIDDPIRSVDDGVCFKKLLDLPHTQWEWEYKSRRGNEIISEGMFTIRALSLVRVPAVPDKGAAPPSPSGLPPSPRVSFAENMLRRTGRPASAAANTGEESVSPGNVPGSPPRATVGETIEQTEVGIERDFPIILHQQLKKLSPVRLWGETVEDLGQRSRVIVARALDAVESRGEGALVRLLRRSLGHTTAERTLWELLGNAKGAISRTGTALSPGVIRLSMDKYQLENEIVFKLTIDQAVSSEEDWAFLARNAELVSGKRESLASYSADRQYGEYKHQRGTGLDNFFQAADWYGAFLCYRRSVLPPHALTTELFFRFKMPPDHWVWQANSFPRLQKIGVYGDHTWRCLVGLSSTQAAILESYLNEENRAVLRAFYVDPYPALSIKKFAAWVDSGFSDPEITTRITNNETLDVMWNGSPDAQAASSGAAAAANAGEEGVPQGNVPDSSKTSADTQLLSLIGQVKIFRANEENARLARIWSRDTEINLNKALESLRKGDTQNALWWFDAELWETQSMIDRAEDENKRSSFGRLNNLVYEGKQQILGQRGDDPKSTTPAAPRSEPAADVTENAGVTSNAISDKVRRALERLNEDMENAGRDKGVVATDLYGLNRGSGIVSTRASDKPKIFRIQGNGEGIILMIDAEKNPLPSIFASGYGVCTAVAVSACDRDGKLYLGQCHIKHGQPEAISLEVALRNIDILLDKNGFREMQYIVRYKSIQNNPPDTSALQKEFCITFCERNPNLVAHEGDGVLVDTEGMIIIPYNNFSVSRRGFDYYYEYDKSLFIPWKINESDSNGASAVTLGAAEPASDEGAAAADGERRSSSGAADTGKEGVLLGNVHDSSAGADSNYTATMGNLENDVRNKFKDESSEFIKEMIKAYMVDYAYGKIKTPEAAEESQTIRIWQGYGAKRQQRMMQDVATKTNDRIKFEKSIDELIKFAISPENMNKGAVTILPREKLSPDQKKALDDAVKTGAQIIYIELNKEKLGDDELGQVEGLIGVGRAYLNDDEESFYKLYNLLVEKPVSDHPLLADLKANPILFIDRLRFILRPIKTHDLNDLPKLNNQLKKLLESA